MLRLLLARHRIDGPRRHEEASAAMRFDVLTLFPEIFQGYFTQSLLKLAIDNGLVEINVWNIRDWAKGKHKSVDDWPFGGGPGMVILPEPIFDAVESVQAKALAPGQLILLTPTRHRLRPDAQQILERRRCCFLPLEDSLAALGPRQWQATEPAVQVLRDFTGLHVSSTDADNGMVFFPTPAGATWADLSIRFADGHSVTVRVGAAGGKYHYAQMGMADGRNARPTRQWELLRAFAQDYGVLTWKSPDAGRKNKKRRELLARDLKAFFRIDGEPIVATDDGQGWQTIFALNADD